MAQTEKTPAAAEPIVEPAAAPPLDAAPLDAATEPAPIAASERDLPPFTRSLLKVKVPVMVTLATKKQSLGQIVELGPGSIINFDKSCAEMLELEAGGCRVAQGEAVKIGEKFGLRIKSIILPDERFSSMRPTG